MAATPGNFEALWQQVDAVDGWLTEAQARRLYETAGQVEPGCAIVEIGSFRGRSTITLAAAAPEEVQVVAIDPHAGSDRGPQEIKPDQAAGDTDHQTFNANLAAAGLTHRVTHVRKFSSHAHDEVNSGLGLLFVDGAHRFGPARADITDWGNRVAVGGRMLVHDAFSSVGVTLALLSSVVADRRWRFEGRTGSLAVYLRVDPTYGGRFASTRHWIASALRQIAQLPWFARNVLLKCLILARLRGVARLLGHRGGWPY